MASAAEQLPDPEPDIATPLPSTSGSVSNRIQTFLRSKTVPQKFLAVLLLIFLAKGIVIAFVFPPFSGHDEVMHYAYLKIVSEEGRIPVIPDLEDWRIDQARPGVEQPDFDHAPVELFKYAHKRIERKMSFTTDDWWGDHSTPIWMVRFVGDLYPSGWIYTSNHPPLFYILMAPVYALVQNLDVDTQIYFFRLATIPLGMLTVFFAYMTTRTIFPRDRFLAMLVPVFIAFQPQISYEASMLNNDILSIALTSLVFYLLALGLRRGFPWKLCVLTGFFFGLSILAKNTSAISGLMIAIAMMLGLGTTNYRQWLPKGAVVAAVTGLLIWPWYLYMYLTYGNFTALDRIEELQYWNNGGRSIWDQLTDPDFAWLRWRETWGEFGWRLIALDPSLLWILFYVCLVGVIGVGWWALQTILVSRDRIISFRNEQGYLALPNLVSVEGACARRNLDPVFQPDRVTNVAVATLVLSCLIAYYAILQFGTTFSLTQARYYFPTFNAFAILVMLGYRALTPRRWHVWVEAAFILGWFVLNIVIYTAYVIPYWPQNF